MSTKEKMDALIDFLHEHELKLTTDQVLLDLENKNAIKLVTNDNGYDVKIVDMLIGF